MRTFSRILSVVVAAVLSASALAPPAGAAPPTDVVTGTVVDSGSGERLGGVEITVYDALLGTTYGTTTTNGGGRFRLTGIEDEEIAVHVDGSAVGHETGYLSCEGTVVPTFGEACTTSPGRLGTIPLDPVP
jgi:hypothetical protein